MSVSVTYFTQTGNTKKVADAVDEEGTPATGAPSSAGYAMPWFVSRREATEELRSLQQLHERFAQLPSLQRKLE